MKEENEKDKREQVSWPPVFIFLLVFIGGACTAASNYLIGPLFFLVT